MANRTCPQRAPTPPSSVWHWHAKPPGPFSILIMMMVITMFNEQITNPTESSTIIAFSHTPSQMQRNHGLFDEHESWKVSPDFITDPVAVEEVTWWYDDQLKDQHIWKYGNTVFNKMMEYMNTWMASTMALLNSITTSMFATMLDVFNPGALNIFKHEGAKAVIAFKDVLSQRWLSVKRIDQNLWRHVCASTEVPSFWPCLCIFPSFCFACLVLWCPALERRRSLNPYRTPDNSSWVIPPNLHTKGSNCMYTQIQIPICRQIHKYTNTIARQITARVRPPCMFPEEEKTLHDVFVVLVFW